MKKLLIWLLFLPTLIMADAVIFSGSDVKALKQNLDLFGVVKVMSGTLDPSAGGGVAAPVGSAYLSKIHGLFLKTGVSNTAWTKNALLPVDLTAQVTGILPPTNGGTGSSAVPTNGQIPIGNGTNYQAASITGTTNQVSVTNGAGSITLSTPQDIATTSNVQFANLNATGTTTLNSGLTGPLKASSGVVSSSAIDLTGEVTGTLPIANGGTGSATQNFVDLTTNQTVAGEKTFSNTLKSDSIQTTGSSGVVIKNSSGTTVADFGPANTTNASIAGGLNVGGNLLVTGTAGASNLSGTNTGDLVSRSQSELSDVTMNTIEIPNEQFTTTAAGKRLVETGNSNELKNRGFEASTVTDGWIISNATDSANTSNPLAGKKSLSLSLTGALSLSQSSTINAAQKSGVQMVASVWVNSNDVIDLQLCSTRNGAEDKCTVTGGYVQGSGWRQLTVSFLGDSTSNGLKLKSTDTTGTVLVDQAFVGLGSPIVDFAPDMVYSAYISNTGVITQENTSWLSSCTNSHNAVCTFKSGIFTVAPNCTASSNHWAAETLSTSTNVTINRFNTTTGAATSTSTYIICQKQGADYKTSKAYVASSSDTDWTSCGHTTSDFTGFGTVSSINLQCKRKGGDLKIKGSFVSGSPSSSEARINLKFNGSTLAASSAINGTQIAGYASRNVANNGASIYTNLIVANSGYITLSFANNATANPLISQQGATIIVSGDAYVISNELTIPIQGWQDSGVIVGSFQGYNETPGTSRVETFSVSYGTTNATTNCTASPCSYLDQIGNAVTSVTRASQGNYTMNMAKTYSKLKCSWVGSGSVAMIIGSNVQCSSCSSLAFDTSRRTDGVGDDSRGTLLCQGIPQ